MSLESLAEDTRQALVRADDALGHQDWEAAAMEASIAAALAARVATLAALQASMRRSRGED